MFPNGTDKGGDGGLLVRIETHCSTQDNAIPPLPRSEVLSRAHLNALGAPNSSKD